MVLKVDNYWLVNSETENNVQYKVEKINTSCIDCVLCFNLYNILCTCLQMLISGKYLFKYL